VLWTRLVASVILRRRIVRAGNGFPKKCKQGGSAQFGICVAFSNHRNIKCLHPLRMERELLHFW